MKRNKNFWKGALFGALLTTGIVGLISGGARLFRPNVLDKQVQRKLKQVEMLVDGYYLRSDSLDKETLGESLIKGYVAGLQDPYSAYYNEEETAKLMETTTGEFVGIGVTVSQDRTTKVITLQNVMEHSPAKKAGLMNNDILYKINGEDIRNQSIDDVVDKVRGKEGTQVNITVLRGKEQKEFETEVTRAVIENETVVSEMKEDSIGYMRISGFENVTLKQFQDAKSRLEKQGMQALIIDLRGNPGGNLSTVTEMLDLILPKGTIVYTEDRNGKKEYQKSDEEHKLEIPLTVLVDGTSASASELFSGAVQDYGIGTIVGTTTYGKGVVQQMFQMQDGTCLKVTVSEYFTPKGRNIDGKGIEPDVKVEYEPDPKHPEKDNQLEKALEVTKEKLK